MTNDGARELLISTHAFPCAFTVKAIGLVADDFVGRVLQAARTTVAREAAVQHTVRHTPDGQHAAVTLEIAVESPEEVMAIYGALQPTSGLKFLL